MTKIQNVMIKRINNDDWMCDQINQVIDEINDSEVYSYSFAVGRIKSIMEMANRRKVKDGDNYVSIRFTDDDNRHLCNYLDNKAKKEKETLRRFSVQPE